MAGCTKEIQPQEIKKFVEDGLYEKYERFLQQQQILYNSNVLNNSRVIISCPFPDCQQLFYINDDSPCIECDYGHKFCGKCKNLGWHKKGKCDQVIFNKFSIIQIFSSR
jgi:hypothetical protein